MIMRDEREFDFETSVLLQNKKLKQDVEDLKTLQSVVKENLQLRSRLDGIASAGTASAGSTLMGISELSGDLKLNLGENNSFK